MKQYRSLDRKLQLKVDKALKRFWVNPHDPMLKNHSLQGKLANLWSISAAFDLRLIFEVEGDYVVVVMIAVGSHYQIY